MGIGSQIVLACAAVGALASFATRSRAEEFRNDAGHWKVQTPAKWVRLAPAVMRDKAGPDPPDVTTHVGFEPPGTRPGPDFTTFLLIQEDRGKRPPFETYDAIERELQAEFRKTLGAQPGVSLGAVKLDRKKNRITAEIEMNQPGGPKVQGILYAFLGKDSLVIITCFTPERDYPRHKELFDAMADSFRYDDGYQFAPFDAGKVGMIAAGVCGCGFMVLVVGVAGAVFLFKKKPGGDNGRSGSMETRQRRRF